MKKEAFVKLIEKMSEEMEKNKIHLSKLDADIGDGDHGVNMARGFSAIMENIRAHDEFTIADIFNNVGKTLFYVSAGTSGPLYGVTFKAGGTVCLGKDEIVLADLIQILTIGIEKIQSYGRAVLGDKTLLDSMIPCLESLKASNKSTKEALEDAYQAAIKGRDSVIDVEAKKGRASYLRERSIGHIDPGCESFCILFKCICDSVD